MKPTFITKPLAMFVAASICATSLLLSGCNRGDNPQMAAQKAQEYIERAESYRAQHQYRAAIIELRNALQQNPQDRAAIVKQAAIFNELGQGKSTLKVMEPLAKNANREEALIIAQGYLLQHKYQSALDYLGGNEQRLQLQKDPLAALIGARSALGLGKIEETQKFLDRLGNDNIDANIERARLLSLQKGPEAEQAMIEKLLQENPDNIDLLSESALLAERQGDLARAEDALSKALLDMPTSDILLPQKAAILQRLVTTLTKLGRSNEALVYAKTLADANPSGALLQDKFKQGMELFQAGKLDEAEPILTEVFNESHNETIGMLLGMIRYTKKDLKGAEAYLDSNVDPEIAPDSAMTMLAATQLQLAQPEKLLALFDAQERARIKSPGLKALVGIALLQTGSTNEGSKLIDAALTEQPDNAAIRATLARYYLMSRQPDKAVATLDVALKQRADDNLSRLLITAYVMNRQPEQALVTAKTLATSTPSKAENWWVLGRTALQLQKPDIADSALHSALAQKPDYLPAQLDLAQLLLLRKQTDKAEELFRAVLKQQPDLVPALKGLVITFAQKGAASDTIESQLLAASTSNNAKAILAEYYLRQQRPDDAERLLATLPVDAGNYASQLKQQTILYRSATALQAKDYDKARGYLAKGLESNPNNPDLLVLLARLDLQQKNIDSAKKIAAQLQQTQPPLPQALELSGDIALLEGDTATATKSYRAVWSKIANDGVASKLYQSLAKDPKQAGAFVDEWVQRLPESANARFLSGVIRQQANDPKGAIANYEAALDRNAKDARALNNLAGLYFENGDKRFLATAEKAYQLEPKNAAVLDTYGWLLVKAGQAARGKALLEQALLLSPDTQEIRTHLEEAKK